MLKLNFYFLQFLLKVQSCEESAKDKSSGEKPKLTNYVICFCYLASLSRFFTKTAKLSQYSQCLHSLFTQLWDAVFFFFEVLILCEPCGSPFNKLSQSTFVYSDLLLFTSPVKFL